MAALAEAKRIEGLRWAQANAVRLFEEIAARGLIRPGITELELNDAIYALAQEMFGIRTYWHKRIVRAGENTLLPYDENPPNLTLREDEILFLDFGPVFEAHEADFGRTYVIGNDPDKLRLRDDTAASFTAGRRHFEQTPELAAAELFQFCVEDARRRGWEFGGTIAGHLIGQFPHERIPEDKISLYVHPKNLLRMRDPDAAGQVRHWILEIHLVDRAKKIGGFFEELLTI